MKKQIKLLSGLLAAAALCGCVSFQKCTVMPGDSLNDETNMPYVARDIKTYEARKSFKKPVMVKMSEKGMRYLSLNNNYRNAGKVFLSRELRKDLMAAAESKLVSIVNGLRDFQLVNMESTLSSTPGAKITVVSETPSPDTPYLLTYNVVNLEVKDAADVVRTAADIADFAMALSGVDRHDTARVATRRAKTIRWYYVDVTIEVNLVAPDGKNIFTFAENVLYPKKFPNGRPGATLMKDAVAHAVQAAMGRYVIQFGPPLYVDQMIGNGLFVRLSAGTEYGIRDGQTVRFYRQYLKKYPTLPGEPEKHEISKQFIREGVVGKWGAPVERDHAWVYVADNDDPALRSVFNWTSAEIIQK